MDKPGKKRLDVLLLERNLAESRNKAQSLILAGQVRVAGPEGSPAPGAASRGGLKPGSLIFENAAIEVLTPARYVSRGGDKLEAALRRWDLRPAGRICLDAGCSTGGFTDCLLQNGARGVIAVDVGYGQFHPKLRSDPRVRLFEKTHILKWRPLWKEAPDFAVVDLSFISLLKVLEKIASVVAAKAELLLLVKPQFELEPRLVRKGVVRNEEHRAQAIESVVGFARSRNLEVAGHFPCPVSGVKGNREEWAYIRKGVT